MASGGDSGGFRIPTVVAVTLWAGCALSVLTYTVIAFKETATDLESALVVGANPLVATGAVLAAETIGQPDKPLNRNKFDPSPEALRGLMKKGN